MMIAENVASLTGPEKKELASDLVLSLIRKHVSGVEGEALAGIVGVMLPKLIDTSIALANGTIRIIKETAEKCNEKCCCIN
jgi:hypothetical protein